MVGHYSLAEVAAGPHGFWLLAMRYRQLNPSFTQKFRTALINFKSLSFVEKEPVEEWLDVVKNQLKDAKEAMRMVE